MAPDTVNYVVQNEVLKSLEVLEEKARKEWAKKWGFYLDFNKTCLEEATKRGMSENEYKRITTMRKRKGHLEPDIWEIQPTEFTPHTTTGYVGWRAKKEFSLEKFGRLYISPKLTLPYEPPYHSIFLG